MDKELALSPDGRWIATADSLGITLWQAGSMTPVANRLAHAAYQSAENLHFSADSRQLRFYSAITKRTVWDITQAADGSVTLAGPGADGPRAPHTLSAASINGRWEATTRSDEKSTNLYLWRDGEIVTQIKRTPD